MKSLVALAILAFTLTVLAVAAPTPALADRCQPEELVTGSGTSPVPEDGDPRCPVMDAVVYDNVVCDDTTLRRCIDTVDAWHTYRLALCRVVNLTGAYCRT